jgi:hypothetical protein
MMGSSGFFADLDKNGYLDLIFQDKRGYVLIYLGGMSGYSTDRTWKIPLPAKHKLGGSVNCADLNRDGWLDLIVGTMGHYQRVPDTMHIYYGSSRGFGVDRSQRLLAGYSPGDIVVADYNKDGHLDLLVTAYSSPTARVLPAQLFWGDGKSVDLDHPMNLAAEGSAGALQIDLNRDGWLDLFLACHRNDVTHQVNSLIYWNGPNGFQAKKPTQLPGLGPHGTYSREHGNIYTREPQEAYVSPAVDLQHETLVRMSWEAEVPPPSQLRFQLRWAATEEQLEESGWFGAEGEDTYFDESGRQVNIPARWLQYRAVFVSPYGCRSPKLREVRFDF